MGNKFTQTPGTDPRELKSGIHRLGESEGLGVGRYKLFLES